MNWKKIFVYIGVLYLATAAVGFLFGFFRGLLHIIKGNIFILFSLGQTISMLVVSVWVFVHLSIHLKDKVFAHAAAAGIGVWLLSFPINVLLLRQPVAIWAEGIIVILIILSVGVLIGTAIKKNRTAA